MIAEDALSFGELLLSLRVAAGLTQEALAERAGLSVRAISSLERGERRLPYPSTVQVLARALRLSAADRARLAAARQRRPARARPAAPTPTIAPIPPVAATLPAPLTSFVGREREAAEVRRLLDETRLLTLTGTGGVGKTRLALEVATRSAGQYRDGAWLVELAPVADPRRAPKAVAEVLGVREESGQPILATLLAAIRSRRLLLVLDNCEHLVEACARLADSLLRQCPQVQILATSREALRIPGETTWRVPSLGLPGHGAGQLEEVAATEAVRLFVDRAKSVQPSFALTDQNAPAMAQVCRQLDGIPLAIELASARMSALSIQQIAARLDDRFGLLTGGARIAVSRHQTLRAVIDWSYGLLTEVEQTVFQRLAVFAGGWTLEAAEAVCAGDGIVKDDVLDVLARLVDKSLVQAEEGDETRYRLLETVRQYARELLALGRHATVSRRRHAAFYLALAEAAAPWLTEPGCEAWFARLAAEHDNLRAALDWADEWGDVETSLRLSGALAEFWWVHGHLDEGLGWLDRALNRMTQTDVGDNLRLQAARARALYHAGLLRRHQGDYGAARTYLTACLALFEDLGDEPGQADAAWALGSTMGLAGDEAAARSLLERSLALSRRLGNARGLAWSLMQLSDLAVAQGDGATARRWFEECMTVAQETSYRTRAHLLWHGARLDILDGDPAAARVRLREALALVPDLQEGRWIIQFVLCVYAGLAALQGQARQALRLAGAAAAVRESIRAQTGFGGLWEFERLLEPARRALSEHDQAAAWSSGQALGLEEAIAEALREVDSPPGVDLPATAPTRARAPDALSQREAEVAALVARGLSNRQIAAELSIAERTVSTHVTHILGKLGFTSRAQVAAWVGERGLVATALLG
jgi:predicted ATPase/DNA-binding CsgD family transcriptional regulator